jgi:hypothetical protein
MAIPYVCACQEDSDTSVESYLRFHENFKTEPAPQALNLPEATKTITKTITIIENLWRTKQCENILSLK